MKIRLGKYDRQWSKLVRERDGKCLVCGRSGEYWKLDAHHWKGRSIKATRFFLPNGISLCFVHHRQPRSDFSAHGTPEAFSKWFKKTHPDRAKQVEARLKTNITEREAIKEFEAVANARQDN